MARLVVLASLLVLLASGGGASAEAPEDSRAAFFANLRALCGKSLEGVTEFPEDPNHDFAGKQLLLTVGPCEKGEIRVPFQVGEDRSRTWVLTLGERGLLLKHDHRHEDGTPDEITMYGGWAADGGTPHKQRFPADEETAKLIPEAVTNVWTLEIGADGRELVYFLERHGQPRYRAVFKVK